MEVVVVLVKAGLNKGERGGRSTEWVLRLDVGKKPSSPHWPEVELKWGSDWAERSYRLGPSAAIR